MLPWRVEDGQLIVILESSHLDQLKNIVRDQSWILWQIFLDPCFCYKLLHTVWHQNRSKRTSILIWTQTVWPSDGIYSSKNYLEKNRYWRNFSRSQKAWKLHTRQRSFEANKIWYCMWSVCWQMKGTLNNVVYFI